jgi:hypothetical protein
MMDTRYYPAKSGKWRIIVEGDPTDAHIRCTGLVPKDVKLSVARKEESGYRNTFVSLEYLAGQLVR